MATEKVDSTKNSSYNVEEIGKNQIEITKEDSENSIIIKAYVFDSDRISSLHKIIEKDKKEESYFIIPNREIYIVDKYKLFRRKISSVVIHIPP